MTLRTWLILFIASMVVDAEVLIWAVRHGQFSHINRGRAMALREPHTWPEPKPRPRVLIAIVLAMAAATLVWADGLVVMLHLAFPRLPL